MVFIAGQKQKVLFGAFDLTGFFNTASMSQDQNVIETNRCMVFEWETRKMVDFTIECIAHNQQSCHQMKLQRTAEKWTFAK